MNNRLGYSKVCPFENTQNMVAQYSPIPHPSRVKFAFPAAGKSARIFALEIPMLVLLSCLIHLPLVHAGCIFVFPVTGVSAPKVSGFSSTVSKGASFSSSDNQTPPSKSSLLFTSWPSLSMITRNKSSN